jgi:hypothetical protein
MRDITRVGSGSASLSLMIDIDSDPITGSVSVGIGEARPFSGWMELVDVIEAARHPVQLPVDPVAGRPSSKN